MDKTSAGHFAKQNFDIAEPPHIKVYNPLICKRHLVLFLWGLKGKPAKQPIGNQY